MLEVAYGAGFAAARHLISMFFTITIFGSLVMAGAWAIERFSLEGIFGEQW